MDTADGRPGEQRETSGSAPESAAVTDGGRDTSEPGDGSDTRGLRVERDEGIGRIVLNRPPMNAILPAMLDGIEGAIERFEADDDVNAVLVVGAGDRAFSAGADIEETLQGTSSAAAADLSRRGQRAFGRIEAADLPVVAGVEGYCLGGGMELAACVDLRVASPEATFGLVESDLGLIPGWGGTQRLRHLVGEGRTREIVLTADRYDAGTMADYGFLTDVAEDAVPRAREYANELAAGPPAAHRLAKRAILAGRRDIEAGFEVEATAFGQLFDTEDAKEGLAAFVEDREPEF